MKKNGFTEAFYKNAGYFVVVLISLVYVASSLISISRTGKSVYEIIGTGALSMIVGALINGIFRSVGIRRGDEDERTVATNELHGRSVDEITPYIDKLDDFCERENKRAIRDIRTRILAREGMKYSDYFDEEGNLSRFVRNAKCKMQNAKLIQSEELAGTGDIDCMSDNGKSTDASLCEQALGASHYPVSGDVVFFAEKAKRKAYRRAVRVKIKPLTASDLTADGVNSRDPFDFGKSKKEFTTSKNDSDIAIKLLMAVIFGYFGVSLTGEINVASIIWNSLQIVLYTASGVIQMYSSYMWVVDDYRSSVVKKIDYLQKFKSYSTNNKTEVKNG